MKEQEHIEEISLANVYLDRETQVRATVSEETIQRYADAMENEECRDKFPPIILYRDNDDTLWLADGHHRVMAAIRRKFQSIHAIIRKGTKADAIWEAAKANSRNGLQFGRSDVCRAIRMILSTCTKHSNRAIADLVGCSESYVRKLADELRTSAQLDLPEKTIGKDGKSRPSKRNRMKSSNPTNKPKTQTNKTATPKTSNPESKREEEVSVEPLYPERSTAEETQLPLETTVEPQNPTPKEEVASADNNITEKANAVESQIMATLTELENMLGKWLEFAPNEQYEAFISRCRKRISEIFG